MRPSTEATKASAVGARESRRIDCTTASALRARWSTSRASSTWRSSASLRSVMSTVTPLSRTVRPSAVAPLALVQSMAHEIGSASGRERGGRYGEILGVAGYLKNKKTKKDDQTKRRTK